MQQTKAGKERDSCVHESHQNWLFKIKIDLRAQSSMHFLGAKDLNLKSLPHL
jgi:hypothetical protein